MTILQEISTLPPAPQRTDPPAVFVPKADAHVASLDAFVTQINAFGDEVNTTQIEMNAKATETNDSADESQASANDSQVSADESQASAELSSSLANLKGAWTDQIGAAVKPYSVEYDGGVWGLLNDLADVTLSEPGVTNDWVQTSGEIWQPDETTAFTMSAGKSFTADGSSNAVDVSLPATIRYKQVFTLHNDTQSTNLVQMLNPSFTIRGAIGSLSAGENLILEAGDTVKLVAKTSLILEVV